MIVVSSALVLPPTGEGNANAPVIGHDNLVTIDNISADTALPDYPITNAANPATDLRWRGGGEDGFVSLVLRSDEASPPAPADASENAHVVEAVPDTSESPDRAPSIDTGEVWLDDSTGSVRFYGGDDYLRLDGSADFAFGQGDFTIEMYVKFDAVDRVQYLYDSRPVGTNGPYPCLYVKANNHFAYFVNGADLFEYTGWEVVVDVWYHVAVVRLGPNIVFYFDGVARVITYDPTIYLNSNNRPLIGASGAGDGAGGVNLDGWIEDLRVSKGIARYFQTFTPPRLRHWTGDQYVTVTVDSLDEVDYLAIAAHNLGTSNGAVPVSLEGTSDPLDGSPEPVWTELTSDVILPDDGPTIFRFDPQVVTGLRLRLQPGARTPTIGVVYVGRLLVLQRNIYVGHTPITYGRAPNIVNARSESGNFLGRIMVGESRRTSVALQNLTPLWYREYFDPFVRIAQTLPFFFAWRPGTYPLECGFAWLSGAPRPANQRVNGMMQVELDLEGVA